MNQNVNRRAFVDFLCGLQIYMDGTDGDFQLDPLREAVTHSSYINEHAEANSCDAWARLGEYALRLVAAEMLLESCRKKEIALKDFQLLCDCLSTHEDILTRAAQELKLENVLLLGASGHSDYVKHPSAKKAILSKALQGVIGVVFHHYADLIRIRVFYERYLNPQLIDAKTLIADPKSDLQILTQQYGVKPNYKVLLRDGSRFLVVVKVRTHEIGRGQDTSIKKAEQAAAKVALETQTDWLAFITSSG